MATMTPGQFKEQPKLNVRKIPLYDFPVHTLKL